MQSLVPAVDASVISLTLVTVCHGILRYLQGSLVLAGIMLCVWQSNLANEKGRSLVCDAFIEMHSSGGSWSV